MTTTSESSRRPIRQHRCQHACSPYRFICRDTRTRYNMLVGKIRHLALRLSTLPADDPFRGKQEKQLLSKLYDMGLLDTGAKMSDIMEKVTVSAFCRRRLPIVMCRLRMSETVKQAVTYVEQGQVRVGTDVITDPAFMVSRNLEDL